MLQDSPLLIHVCVTQIFIIVLKITGLCFTLHERVGEKGFLFSLKENKIKVKTCLNKLSKFFLDFLHVLPGKFLLVWTSQNR